jgi:hypothetical protein
MLSYACPILTQSKYLLLFVMKLCNLFFIKIYKYMVLLPSVLKMVGLAKMSN